ncbi:hypothetical protein [Flavonifractor sp. An306]|uniref:hypothetical protein n=1 Tax=Flavonifractor sp. An306 TaxID=1965629 RepID=UPI001FA931CB|nr:hypothetical protein [Flavonifractor sp. An306]
MASEHYSWPTRWSWWIRPPTFRELWPRATVGRHVESMKQGNAFVVCGSIQSVALNLERFKPDDFGYRDLLPRIL